MKSSSSSSLTIGILQADSVMEQFQPEHGNYPAMIENVLRKSAERIGVDLQFVNYDVEHGVYPTETTECDGYVITGSRKSVYDDEAWIHALGRYVRDLHASRTPLVGICFGHQMIAEVLGGRTQPADYGWGVGIKSSDVIEPRPFMQPAMEKYALLVSHKDQVTSLPDDATLLATSDYCPNAMFMVGDHILALQGHPEFTQPYARDLMEMREDILGPEKFSAGIESLEEPLLNVEVGEWILRFLIDRKQQKVPADV